MTPEGKTADRNVPFEVETSGGSCIAKFCLACTCLNDLNFARMRTDRNQNVPINMFDAIEHGYSLAAGSHIFNREGDRPMRLKICDFLT